jgi:hypothetical protein
MNKKCLYCKRDFPLADFFVVPFDSPAAWKGTSMYCKHCHADGLIPFGYGSFGEEYKTPSFVGTIVERND